MKTFWQQEKAAGESFGPISAKDDVIGYGCEICAEIKCQDHPICGGCGEHVEKVMDSDWCAACMGDDRGL